MKQLKVSLLILFSALGFSSLTQIASSQNTDRVVYNCINRGSYYSTVAKTSRGIIEIINWKRNIWGQKWTPQRRCQEVTKRFQYHSDYKSLKYISTGQMNNYNIICVSDNSGNCKSNGLLITLESRDNPKTILGELFNLAQRQNSGGIDRPSGMMIDVKEVIDVNKDILQNQDRLISTTPDPSTENIPTVDENNNTSDPDKKVIENPFF